jgi:hypothetical protein
LKELVKKNPSSHFFLDEVVFSEEEITSEILAEISDLLSSQSYFWVASRSDQPPYINNQHLKGTKFNIGSTVEAD